MDTKRCISCFQLITISASSCTFCRRPQDLFSPTFHAVFLGVLTTGYGSLLGLALGVLVGADAVTSMAVGGLVGLCLAMAVASTK
jgi:hypothetical protein